MRTKRLAISSPEAGFTLLEMLVVVIMVGVIAAIAAPGWLGYLNRQRMNRVQTDVLQVLQQAQSEAQLKGLGRTVVIGTTAGAPSLLITSEGSTTGNTQELGGDDIGSVKLSSPSTTFTFDYRGAVDSVSTVPFVITIEPVNTDGSSQVGDESKRCVIVTTLLGDIVPETGSVCNDESGYSNDDET